MFDDGLALAWLVNFHPVIVVFPLQEDDRCGVVRCFGGFRYRCLPSIRQWWAYATRVCTHP